MENVQFCRSFKSPQIQCALNAKRGDPQLFLNNGTLWLANVFAKFEGKTLEDKQTNTNKFQDIFAVTL
jgi:hypothetical protein